MKSILLVLLSLFPTLVLAEKNEVLAVRFTSGNEEISWSIGEQKKTSKSETIEALKTFKANHPKKTLIVYKKTHVPLQDWFLYSLDELNIDYKVINVDRKTISDLQASVDSSPAVSHEQKTYIKNRMNRWWTSYYEKPTATEISHGYVMALLKGSIAAPFWFASGVSTEVATLLTFGVAINELLQTRYMRTMDNFYLGRRKGEKNNVVRRPLYVNLAMRSAVTLAFAYLWRSISGPVGSAHSVLTLQGNAELWANMLAKLPGGWLGSVKAQKLSRTASSWFGFFVFGILGSVLNHADLTGVKMESVLHLPPLKIGELVIYQPSTTLVVLFSTILVSTAVIKYGPAEGISKFFDGLDGKIKNFSANMAELYMRMKYMNKEREGTGLFCQSVFAL